MFRLASLFLNAAHAEAENAVGLIGVRERTVGLKCRAGKPHKGSVGGFGIRRPHIYGIDTGQRGAVLVNIARGALVETDALEAELKSRRIYAVLDVFDDEPLSAESDLWGMENVIITPHNSFIGDGNEARLSYVILQNLEDYERSCDRRKN